MTTLQHQFDLRAAVPDQGQQPRSPGGGGGRADSISLAANQQPPRAAFDHLVDLSRRVQLAGVAPALVRDAVQVGR